ncbi:hypothetical protein LZC95_48305 [Pendulispora brunnea]|uniref:Uncharacterized protein n=1 Tax=Pendulispora brunnea TaxID=2905690 RepID=A0ABZ2KA51_9BACT
MADMFVAPPLPELFAAFERFAEHELLEGRRKKPYARWKLNERGMLVYALLIPPDYSWEWGRGDPAQRQYLEPEHYPTPIRVISQQVIDLIERRNLEVEDLSAFSVESRSTCQWVLEVTIARPNSRGLKRRRDW